MDNLGFDPENMPFRTYTFTETDMLEIGEAVGQAILDILTSSRVLPDGIPKNLMEMPFQFYQIFMTASANAIEVYGKEFKKITKRKRLEWARSYGPEHIKGEVEKEMLSIKEGRPYLPSPVDDPGFPQDDGSSVVIDPHICLTAKTRGHNPTWNSKN
jgi:hypothetical protein